MHSWCYPKELESFGGTEEGRYMEQEPSEHKQKQVNTSAGPPGPLGELRDAPSL